jgi:hypothetical protein
MKGLIVVSIWVPLGGLYNVQWGRVLKQQSTSTLPLMHRTLPYALFVQVLVSPLVDPPGFLQFVWTPSAVFWISLSGVVSFLVNLSGFLVMGSVGGMAHVLLGQVKTIVICLCAYYLFDSQYTILQITSAAGALASILTYTHFSIKTHDN